ncbi:MAG: pre-peptidase [Planctomycetes bacterium]|nr:pre-peptidase [Planctomycetota bacterium]
MSTRPVAVQVGTTSEVEVEARYSMFGAQRVVVTGEGVSGEIATPMEPGKDGKAPNLTKLKLKLTVAADALPGVRDFRLVTPTGASTLGQLVIVRDPVVSETRDNNSPEKAQPVTIPATLCGAIERAEDVDYFRFTVEAGQALTFHVRAMRLQDRIHDLQAHVDPIIAVKNAAGSTVATSDNVYAADPLLAHRFAEAGEYLLEIRDVRYQGNGYWQYAIEVSDRPFVTNVFPLAVKAGEETAVEPVGHHMPERAAASFALPAGTPLGPRFVQLPFGDGLSNPVELIVSDLPLVREEPQANDAPAAAELVSGPVGINGRIEAEADIDCFAFEAKKGERYSFEVLARRHGSPLDPIIRVLAADGKQLAENDDLRIDKRGYPDSLIEFWAPPADGRYVVEVRDLHLRGGADFVYFLKMTTAQAYFELYLDTDKTQLFPGTSGVVFANAIRKNGFDGAIELSVDGLPEGVTASPGAVPAGRRDGSIIFTAAADAQPAASNITVRGTASHPREGGDPLALEATARPYQETYLPGGGRGHWPVDLHTLNVGAPCDIRGVTLSTHEVTLKPGGSQRIDVKIERAPGFKENVQLDLLFRHLSSVYADTLPPGVTIDTKNSSTLLTGQQTDGHITLTAAANAAPAEKVQVAVMANVSLNFVMKATYCASPLFVSVEKP